MASFDKIIILGHTGFFGQALYSHFLEQSKVPTLGFSSATVNLMHPSSLKKIEQEISERSVLILCSAITREKNDTLEAFEMNTKMVANVAAFLEAHPVKKCVYFSSISVYGDAKTDLAINEETGVNPDSFYALAKFAGEFIIRRSAIKSNFPLLILRAGHVYGPGDTHATYGPMKFIRTLLDEKTVYLFDQGDDLRDRLYIDDMVLLTQKLVESPANGIFNLVTGKSESFWEVVERLKEIVPFSFKIVHRLRKKPLIHQKFDVKKLSQFAPGFRFSDPKEALKITYEAFASAAMSKVV